jgi:hypothetical protein
MKITLAEYSKVYNVAPRTITSWQSVHAPLSSPSAMAHWLSSRKSLPKHFQHQTNLPAQWKMRLAEVAHLKLEQTQKEMNELNQVLDAAK